MITMNKWLRLGLILFFSVTFLLSAFMLGRYYWESDKQQAQFDELAEMVRQATPSVSNRPIPQTPTPLIPTPEDDLQEDSAPQEPAEPLPQYIEVSKLNSDMIGWMCIDGTRINYPVMQTLNNPDFYLKRDFYKNYSGHGCLYVREQCDVDAPSDNVTIYGHNMKDGSMFADLLNYRNKSYWESHRYIFFDTLTEQRTYEIFAIFKTTASKGKGFAYHQFVDADNEAEYNEFIEDCLKLSLYNTEIVPVCGEKLITLSTCEYTQSNGRFVVVARRIS